MKVLKACALFAAAVMFVVPFAVLAKTGGSSPNSPTDDLPHAKSGPIEGDPVGLCDGSVYDAATDIRVACPDIDLVFRRSYGSWSQKTGALGLGWTHSYDWSVELWEDKICVHSAAENGVNDGSHVFPKIGQGENSVNEEGYRLSCGEDWRFAVTDPGGLRYGFDSHRRLESIETWNGTTVSIVRDPQSGSPVRVEHSCGKALTFELDGGGRIVKVVSPSPSAWVEYSYVTNGSGVSTGGYMPWQPFGDQMQEDVDITKETVLLSRVEVHDNATVAVATYEYETFKRSVPMMSGTSSASGNKAVVTSVSVHSAGGGNSSDGGSLGSGGVPSQPHQRRFFVREYALSAKTDFNGISSVYEYLGTGAAYARRCRHTAMTGGIMAMDFLYGGGTTHVSRETVFGGVMKTLRFDSKKREVGRTLGDEVSFSVYDDAGDMVLSISTNTATAHFRKRAYVYDSMHRRIGESTAYDAEPTLFTSVEWDDIDGEPCRFVSRTGRVSERVRDDHSYTMYGAGSNDERCVSSVVCDMAWHPVLATGPDGGETRFFYGAGGLVSRIEKDTLPPVDLGYDALGHISSLAIPGPGATARTTTLTNNWRGRPLSVVHPDGTAESFAYDGNGTKIVRHIDQLGRKDAYKWVLGLPVHAGRVIGGVTNTLFGVEHDKHLNVVSITDPLGRKAEAYTLDANDRVVAVTNVEGQVMTRAYALGELVASETRFDGTTVAYGYDTDANLSSVAYPGETLSFDYDADGLLTSASNSVGVVTNSYDASTGWLDASSGADGTWVEYARSIGGSVTSVTSVAGTTAYSLDAAGRRTHLATPSAAFEFGYCEWNGRLAAVTNSSGFVVQYAYDIMDRVTNISWRTTTGASLGGFSYEYDALGRIVSRSHALGTNAFDRVYNYDDFDRLASDGYVAYAYDAAGNCMTRTEDGDTITYTLGVGDRLASWTGGAYTHDAAGNVTRIERDGSPTLDLAWNSQYQLVSVSTNGAFAESYEYDAIGRRVSTTTAEGTTRHVYDNNWQVIADIDENGNLLVSYVWGEGIDKLLAVAIGGTTYYPLTDVQGTVWGYVDSQNTVVTRWTYDAWGNVLSEYVASSASVLSKLRYRFQGREWSANTGLINFRMRWYDTETGRWLSKDPIGLSGGLNLYEFCGGDPLSKMDAVGLCSIKNTWKNFATGIISAIKSLFPEGFFDVAGNAATSTAIGTAKTTAQALEAGPGVVRILSAAQQIDNINSILSGDDSESIESKASQLKKSEESVRNSLRGF